MKFSMYLLLGGWLIGLFPAVAFSQQTVSTTAYANSQGIQNGNPLCLIFDKSTAENAVCSSSSQSSACYNLMPGGQEWITITQKGGWISLDFHASSYDFAAKKCGDDNLGGVTITFADDGSSPKVTSYNNEQPKVYTVDQNSKLYGLLYSPTVIPEFPVPATYPTVPYRGINLSGAEFHQTNPMNNQLPTAYDALYFVEQGMNTVRIPFRWEYLQPDPKAPIDFSQGYGEWLMNLVRALTGAQITVILDMHNYMRFPLNKKNIDGPIIGLTSKATTADYANAWGQIAAQLVQDDVDSDYVMLDLMNEPWSSSSSPLPTEMILTNYNAAIAAIRQANFKGWLLLEGNAFSGALDWSKNYYGTPNADVLIPANIKDPLNHYAINVHQYLGPDNNPTTGACINPSTLLSDKNFSDFMSWVSKYQVAVILTETGGIPKKNCYADIDTYLSAVEANPYQDGKGGFIGWLGWVGGQAWYLVPDSVADKQLFIAPDINGKERPQMTQGFSKHLTGLGGS